MQNMWKKRGRVQGKLRSHIKEKHEENKNAKQ